MSPPTKRANPGIIKPKLSNCNPILNSGIGKLNKNNGNPKRLIKNGNNIKPISGIAIASFNRTGKINPFNNINPRAINGRTNTFKNSNGTNNGSNTLPNPIKATNGNVIRCANKLFNNINGVNAKNVNPLAKNGNPSTNRGLIRIFRGRITKSNKSLSTPGSAKRIANVSPNNLNPLTKLLNTTIGKMIKAGMLARANMMPRLIKIGNTALTIGNVIKVLRPKFNKNNGKVNNPETIGKANNPRIFNPVLISGNNNKVANTGSANLAKSLRTLNNAIGVPTKPSVNANGNNTGNNGQKIGLSIVNNVNNPSAGIASANNESIGNADNGPRISFKMSANLNGNNILKTFLSTLMIGSNGHNNGFTNANNLPRPNRPNNNGRANNPSRSSGNLINPFNAPSTNGIKFPKIAAIGNANNPLPNNINGNNNKSVNSLIGKLPSNANNGNNNVNGNGNANNIIASVTNGNVTKKLSNPANNGRPNINNGRPTNLNKSLKILNGNVIRSHPSSNQKATLLTMLSNGKLNHNGIVNKASPNGKTFLNNFNPALNKFNGTSTKNVNACASNGNPSANKLPNNTFFNNLSKNIGKVANKSNNGKPSNAKASLTKFAIGYVNNPANAPHRRGAIRFLKVSSKSGSPSNCVNNNNGRANNLTPGINVPNNANKLSNGKPSNPRISSGKPPNRPLKNGTTIAAKVAGTKLVNKFNKMSPGTNNNFNNSFVLNVLNAAMAGTKIQLIGFKNCNGPKIGNNNKFINPATNNGRIVFFNKSFKNLNGMLKRFNNDNPLINAGIKNNPSKAKSKNGTNPGNARSPNKMNLLIVLIKSLANLKRFAKTMIGLSNNPIKTGKKFATKADNPFAIKNGTTPLAIGNVNNVNKPRFNKNNGNVRRPLNNGNSNKLNASFTRLINGNANNEANNASGKPSNNALAISPIVLNNVNGCANKLERINGNKIGANKRPNPGTNNAKPANSVSNGNSNKFKRSIGKFPRRSLKTSVNANGSRNNPNGHSNGVNKFNNGTNGNNKLNNPSPSNLRRSIGNLIKCLSKLPNSNGANNPARRAAGNPSNLFPNNTNGNRNRSNKILIGKIGNAANNGNNNVNRIGNDNNMLSNVINGSPSNNVASPANNGRANNNNGNPRRFKISLKPLNNVNKSTGKINALLNRFKAGSPSHNGIVNNAIAKFNKFKPSLIALLTKLNIATSGAAINPANNGKPNNNNGRKTNALLNNFNKKIGNVANNPSNGNNAISIKSLTKFAIGYVRSPANVPQRSGANKFLNESINSGKPSS